MNLLPNRQPVPGGWLFVLGPCIILAVAALYLYANWNTIPESFPMHWGRNGGFAIMAGRTASSADPVRGPSQMVPLILISFLALIAVLTVYLARVARSRTVIGDRTPDECWKWGLFYYNPRDSALFVEKRLGIGWTLNFAHKKAWVFMALMLLPSILIIFGTLFAVRAAK